MEQALDCLAPRRRASSLPADARRSMIIEAALPLLLARGETVTTHEIAGAAGIAEGTIFRVFESKDALIEAVIDRVLDTEHIEEALAGIDPNLDLETIVTRVVKLVQHRVLDTWQLISSLGPRFRRDRRPSFDSPALAGLFEAHRTELAVEPASAARVLRAITIAMTHPLMASEPARPTEVAGQFLHGVVRSKC
jgi:AcrR family transcriptional regulator